MTAAKGSSGKAAAKGKPPAKAAAKPAAKPAKAAPRPQPKAATVKPSAPVKAASKPAAAKPVAAKPAVTKAAPAVKAAATPAKPVAKSVPAGAKPTTSPAKAITPKAAAKGSSPGRKGRGDSGSEANLHKRVDSERIALHIAAFEKSGGRVEKLGVTRVLQKVNEVAATAPAQAVKSGSRRR